MLARAALQADAHVLAHFIFFYVTILDAPMRVFESNEEAHRCAGIWHFGAEEMDYLYEQKKDADPDRRGAGWSSGWLIRLGVRP